MFKWLADAGWARPDTEVLVMQPELENWVWLPYREMARVIGWRDYESLVAFLAPNADFNPNPKPRRPKEAFEAACIERRIPRSSTVYRAILRDVPAVRRCTDPCFLRLQDALRRWFPVEEAIPVEVAG